MAAIDGDGDYSSNALPLSSPSAPVAAIADGSRAMMNLNVQIQVWTAAQILVPQGQHNRNDALLAGGTAPPQEPRGRCQMLSCFEKIY